MIGWRWWWSRRPWSKQQQARDQIKKFSILIFWEMYSFFIGMHNKTSIHHGGSMICGTEQGRTHSRVASHPRTSCERSGTWIIRLFLHHGMTHVWKPITSLTHNHTNMRHHSIEPFSLLPWCWQLIADPSFLSVGQKTFVSLELLSYNMRGWIRVPVVAGLSSMIIGWLTLECQKLCALMHGDALH